MKYSCALALVATAVTGLSLPQLQQTAFHDQAPFLQEKFLIELAPGDTRWVTEDEKWELKRVTHQGSAPQVNADALDAERSHFHGYNYHPPELSPRLPCRPIRLRSDFSLPP